MDKVPGNKSREKSCHIIHNARERPRYNSRITFDNGKARTMEQLQLLGELPLLLWIFSVELWKAYILNMYCKEKFWFFLYQWQNLGWNNKGVCFPQVLTILVYQVSYEITASTSFQFLSHVFLPNSKSYLLDRNSFLSNCNFSSWNPNPITDWSTIYKIIKCFITRKLWHRICQHKRKLTPIKILRVNLMKQV